MSNGDDIYQDIGAIALDVANDLSGKLLVYSEVSDGVISSDIFYQKNDGIVKFLYSPAPLQELIYSFWERWTDEPGNKEWRAMIYVIEDGKFFIDFVYPDQMDHLGIDEHRPLVVQRHFGDAKIDYSSPE